MASAGGAWKNTRTKEGGFSIFTKAGESTKKAIARYRKNNYAI